MTEPIEINNEDIHDFRPDKLGWGWNGISLKITDETLGKQKAEMKGVSGKVRIKRGQYIYCTHGEQAIVWHIDDIRYEYNPKDMFDAKLSYAGVPEEE